MDEAVLRIVLDESSTNNPSTAAANPAQTPPPANNPTAAPPPPPPPPTQSAPPAQHRPPPQQQQPQPPPKNPEWLESLIAPKRGATPLDDANPHVLVEGQSGSGKSMATRHIAMERMKRGEDVYVADQHTPQSWGGAKEVFQGQSAGSDAAKFMLDTLKERIKQQSEATLKGEKVDFKPITIVLSDFARLMRETPQMQDALKSLLTEGRKFRIGVLADTTALTGAASGIKGINDVRNNFGQRAQFYPPTPDDPTRQVRIGGTGGEKFDVPILPDYKEKYDPNLVKPATATDTNTPVGAAAAARRQLEKEKYDAEIAAEYAKLKPPEPEAPFDPVEIAKKRLEKEKERQAIETEYAKLKPPEEEPEPEPPKPFDPIESARQRREAEQRRAQVDAAYKDQYGDRGQDSVMDRVLDSVNQLRGTMGGLFGTMAGAALDVVQGFRENSKKQEKEAYDKQLIAEAERRDAPEAIPMGSAPVAKRVEDTPAIRTNTRQAAKLGPEGYVPPLPKGGGPPNDPPKPPPMAEAIPVAKNLDKMATSADAVGMSMATIVPAIAAATVAFGAITSALDTAVQRYGEYSPAIATAEANVEVAKIGNDLRRAEQYGPELARYVESQGRMQEKYEEAKMKFLMTVSPVIEGIFEVLGTVATLVGGIAEVVGAPFKLMQEIAGSLGQLVGFGRDKEMQDVADGVKDPTDHLFKGIPGAEIPEV